MSTQSNAMKIYLRAFSLFLCCSTFLMVGCDNQKGSNPKSDVSVGVINSYLFHTEPELLPTSKLIKQQRIEGQGNKAINYNQQGYVINYDLAGLHAEVNYETAKYAYSMQDKKNEYDITFDESKNIVGMKNPQGDLVASSKFDEQGQLVEVTLSHFADSNIIFRNEMSYDKGHIAKILYSAYVPVDEKTEFPVFSQEKNMLYNANQQLEKTITKIFKLTSDGKVVVNSQNEPEVDSTETCSYFEYNANNDWTKAVCETTGSEVKTVNLTRTVQYE